MSQSMNVYDHKKHTGLQKTVYGWYHGNEKKHIQVEILFIYLFIYYKIAQWLQKHATWKI